MEEGTRFDPLITQFHYKDDPLHDPMLDEAYINFITRTKGSNEYARMRELNADTFEYWHRGIGKDYQYTYALVAVNAEGREGVRAYITVPSF